MRTEVEKYYDLNDPSKKGPRGFVFAYDENGELLFHKENMITEAGRKALMKYGFDKNESYITKVVVGNNEDLTTPADNNRDFNDVFGNQKYIIYDRIIDSVYKNIIYGITDGTDNKYMTDDQKGVYSNIISNMEAFKKLSIDKDTGNIISEGNIIIHSQHAAKIDNILEIQGYDGSCFDIAHDEEGQLLGLCKIFIRHTDDDIETTNTGYSQDWYSCLGLFMGDTLFSRVVFPRYYKTSTNSIMFNYYIYF